MWADAQRDGRPVEYRWRPVFIVAKFGWRPLLECRAVTLPRRETRWNVLGVSQTGKPISVVSGPTFTILWRHVEEILLFNEFFSIVDMCISCQNTARQLCAMVRRWQIFGDFWVLYFSAGCVPHVSDLHLKFALRPHPVWKYGRHPVCGGWD